MTRITFARRPATSRNPQAGAARAPVVAPRIAYLDLDGTLTNEGSMLHGGRGPTLDGARALLALHEANVAIVPASGRTVMQLREVARLLGSRDFIAELGSVVVRGGVEHVAYDAAEWPGTHSPLGARLVETLRAEFAVEPYEPWFSLRRHTVLLRGPPGLGARLAARAAEVAPGVTAIDNGEVEKGLHAYHVLPAVVSKEHAIRLDLEARGLSREDAVAFGDSEGDRSMARAVGTMYHLGGKDGERIVGVPERFAEGLLRAVKSALG